jgi:hypothetical protein
MSENPFNFCKGRQLILEIAGVIAALKRPLDDLYNGSTGALKKLVEKWQTAGEIDDICQKIQEVELVPTMFRSERTPLSSFYYPSRVETRSTKVFAVDKLDDISSSGNVLILGTVGQGKSMFMRYMCVQQLRQGHKIPLFIELRGLDEKNDIRSLITDKLATLGMSDVDKPALDFILERGSLTLFLDGFDEIKREQVNKFRKDMFEIFSSYPDTRVVMSSRPVVLSQLILQGPSMKMVSLSKLRQEDFRPFLLKLGRHEEHLDLLLKAIAGSSVDIQAVLTTPLMLTLLNEAFGSSANIPDTLQYFYESLFTVLVLRHDQLKHAFSRQRATALNNLQLQEAFECFAFLSKDFGVSLTDDQFAQCGKDVASLSQNNFLPDDLKRDFTEAVCLMMPDGLKTAFIHKSIQEFFAAFYISHLKDEQDVEQIYNGLSGQRLLAWQQELSFLEKMDNSRYLRYFRGHFIREFLKFIEYNSASRVKVTKANFKKYIDALEALVVNGQHLDTPYVLMNTDAKIYSVVAVGVGSALAFPTVANFTRKDFRRLPKSWEKIDLWKYLNGTGIDEKLERFRKYCADAHNELTELTQDLAARQKNSREILFRKRRES